VSMAMSSFKNLIAEWNIEQSDTVPAGTASAA
jgi:hypothetical protein